VEEQKFPPYLPIFFTGLIIALVGWSGLAYTILFLDPELPPRWLFFFLLFLGLCGTALPIVAFLNRRFASRPPAGEGVLVRQSAWVGIYGCLLAWLQQGRILNTALVLFLAIGFILIEVLLRLGERARWKPKETPNE
jgi:hypothetical protein